MTPNQRLNLELTRANNRAKDFEDRFNSNLNKIRKLEEENDKLKEGETLVYTQEKLYTLTDVTRELLELIDNYRDFRDSLNAEEFNLLVQGWMEVDRS